ncbi:MAG: TonB-dependent receptor plug domain-containing protein, partial [Salinibacter sp.]
MTLRIPTWIALLLVGGGPALAQTPSTQGENAMGTPADSLWQLDMDPVVVTATRGERRAEEVAVPVSVIGQREIESQGAARMTDLLASQPGLTINTDHGSGLQMRGLGADYTLILVDGEPIIGRTAGTLDLDRLTAANVQR